MTKKICVFPGQGSQKIGMGKEFYDNFAEARMVFEEVNDALNQKLTAIIFDGTDEDLTLTENTQPAIMATSIAMLEVMKKEAGFDIATYANYVAGHSLGEYTALTAAGAISLSDSAKLLRTRGQAMQKAVPVGVGGMAVILGLEMAEIEKITKTAAANGGVCEVANDNSPGQIVVSGTKQAIVTVCVLAKEAGAKRAMELPVSAPFHCSLIKSAADVMQNALQNTTMNQPCVPLIANVTASEIVNVDEIKKLLVEQVTSRVRWTESITYAAKQNVTKSLEIGEGKVLSGLIKRISKDIETSNISKISDLETFNN